MVVLAVHPLRDNAKREWWNYLKKENQPQLMQMNYFPNKSDAVITIIINYQTNLNLRP